ncbi:MAG TPA: PH domain-containing protein [Acidobacteriota bacterium]|nr:PH domain-containing protein [Acidobacteriota bacterium]
MSFTKKQLLPGENLILLSRQHPLVLFKPVLVNAIALALLIGICVYSRQLWFLAVYAVPLIYLIGKVLSWRRKEYILTDRRVVLQEGVLSISSFDASLDKINNVYHNQSFLGRLLNYGDVGLETASEAGTTTFEILSHPVRFKNSIVRQRELYRMDFAAAGRSLPPDIPKLLEDLASLRDRNIITESEFQEKKRSLLQKI